MPVVHVRPVRVRVHEALVTMAVGVSGAGGQIRMGVEVMAVVVAVAVDVLQGFVRVGMPVPAPEEGGDGDAEQRSGRHMAEIFFYGYGGHREPGTDEGCA